MCRLCHTWQSEHYNPDDPANIENEAYADARQAEIDAEVNKLELEAYEELARLCPTCGGTGINPDYVPAVVVTEEIQRRREPQPPPPEGDYAF